MANDWNNVKPVGCKPWLVLPAVYSDALSYGDQIAHFCAALNKLIQNNNTLPEYIQQMIQDYINGDVIGEVVQNIVSQFILNVKYPPENLKPAVGDGSADDTEAIQGCINYAKNHNGMAVYIPSGAYSVQSLTLPGDVSLFGFDRYTTKLVLRGGATTPMISSVGTGFSIIGLTLDGNAGVQVENINVLSLISQDVLLRDLIVQNGYQLLVYNGTGGHLQMDNIVFGNTVYRCVNISGSSVVQAKNLKFTQLSAVSGVDVINISSDNGMYDFISNVSCDTCLSVSGNDNYFSGIVSGATTPYVDSGLRNTIDFRGYAKKEYYSDNIDTTVEGDAGFTANGAYSENISGAFTSVRNGTESKVVTGESTEQYNSTQTETITGKKTINAQDIYLNPTNPLQYKTPADLTDFFSSIQFKDTNNNYNVLVANAKTKYLGTNFVNVLEYGAVGDGVTDDSEAFQAAIDSGFDVFVPTSKGQIYLIENTLNFTKARQTMYGDVDARSMENNANVGYIDFNINTGIYVTAMNVHFQSLSMKNHNSVTTSPVGTCINVDTTQINNNGDLYLYNCFLYGFVTGVTHKGRGLEAIDNRIAECTTAFNISYDYDGTGGSNMQQPDTGFRGIRIINNRFHGVRTICNVSEGHIVGPIIANNVSDLGSALFVAQVTSKVSYALITNNIDIFNFNVPITIYGDIDHTEISNNIFCNLADRLPPFGIHAVYNNSGEQYDFSYNTICNNVFYNINQDGMLINRPILHSAITGNIFHNVGVSGNNKNCIRFRGATDTIFNGNIFDPENSTIGLSCGNGTLNNCKIENNTYNTTLLNNYQLGTTNNIQDLKMGSAPTTGTWKVGDIVYKSNPIDFIGWVCTESGSPGTWKTFGAVTQ